MKKGKKLPARRKARRRKALLVKTKRKDLRPRFESFFPKKSLQWSPELRGTLTPLAGGNHQYIF
jgi:hypothetical protein